MSYNPKDKIDLNFSKEPNDEAKSVKNLEDEQAQEMRRFKYAPKLQEDIELAQNQTDEPDFLKQIASNNKATVEDEEKIAFDEYSDRMWLILSILQ